MPNIIFYVLLLSQTTTKKEVLIIYERILSESKRLDKQISLLQDQLKKFPPGKLICTRNGKRYKWYQSDGHNIVYIPKKNQSLAEKLAVKKYLSYTLEDLLTEKRALQFYLDHHHSDTGKAEQLLTQHPEFQKLLSPYFTPLSKELSDWMYFSYDRNPKYPEQPIHKSSSGNLVRCKSEAMIDMLLHTNNIPFHYECALQLGDITIFPDFTIRHPKTGEFYYWEHFGMMDNPAYSKKVSSKLDLYIAQGIIPSIQLITTYETKNIL